MTSLASRFIEVKSIYNGVVPIIKPSGVSSNDIIKFMSYDLNYYINKSHTVHTRSKIKIGCASILEPFASGVLTLFLGKSTCLSPAFLNAKHTYKARVKFGEQRQTGCVDGPIIGQSSYDHLKEKFITDEAAKYVGITKQQYPSYVYDRIIFDANESTLAEIERRRNSKTSQRYPMMVMNNRLVECQKLHLIHFSPPYAEFLICCSGTFSVRQFFIDLSKQLESYISLIELHRLQEGPFSLDNVTTQIYHLHYEILSQRLAHNDSIKENDCMNQYMRKIQQAV